MSDMLDITLRSFLRDFPKARKQAGTGKRVRIRARDATYIFFELQGNDGDTLLSCCKDISPSRTSVAKTSLGKRCIVGPLEDPDAWEANQ